MIQIIKFNNPITNKEDILEINIDNIINNYSNWLLFLTDLETDLFKKLYNILYDLNCTIEYKSGRPMMTSYPRYKTLIEEYCKFLNRIDNYIIYNKFYDKLIDRHINNLIFEYENPIIKNKSNNKNKKSKCKTGIWIKDTTKDLFTGEIQYIYENTKTGEHIITDNANYLEELTKEINNKSKTKSKIKQVKEQIDVSLNGVTFKF